MSALEWVDFSSEHREKVKSVIDLLSTPGVIDELGIGVIRDSFSDSLFPGISTIQTRRNTSLRFLAFLRTMRSSRPTSGGDISLLIISMTMKTVVWRQWSPTINMTDRAGSSVSRLRANKARFSGNLPSAYWTGIRQFGLIQTKLSLQAFCRKFANPDQPLQDLVQGSDKTTGDDPDAAEQANETINGPASDDDWIESLTIPLSNEEASFLSRQIEARVPLSLLGQILLDAEVRTSFLDLPNDWNFTTLADEAPFLVRLPDSLQRIIAAARDFWQLIYGATSGTTACCKIDTAAANLGPSSRPSGPSG